MGKTKKKVEEIQDELKVLKNEIKDTLVDLREHLLTYAENPFNAGGPVQAQPWPEGPSPAGDGPPRQAGPPVAIAITAPSPPANVGATTAAQAAAPPAPQPEARKPEPQEPIKAPELDLIRKEPEDELDATYVDPKDMPKGEVEEDAPGQEEQEEDAEGAEDTAEPLPLSVIETPRAEETAAMDAMETPGPTVGPMPLAAPADPPGPPPPSSSYHAAVQEPTADQRGEPSDLLTIALVSGWMEQHLKTLGSRRLKAILDVYDSMGGLSGRLKDVLLRLIELDDRPGRDGPVSIKDYLRVIAELDSLLYQTQSDRASAVLSSLLLTANGNGHASRSNGRRK